MINKFYKTIHNKYLKFFRFIFFLRYLFVIFGISIALFLIIPNYFNYTKRYELIKSHLSKNYNFELIKYEKINFKALPVPKLEIHNAKINIDSSEVESLVKSLNIYPKFLSIYNYDNFQTKKIVIKNSNIILNTPNFKFLKEYILNKKEKFILDNLNLIIKDDDKFIIKLENMNFSNFGFDKNIITGRIYGKEFKVKIKNDLRSFNLKILNSGIDANINFEESQKDDLILGTFKSKILNSKIKFNFVHDYKKLNIFNSYFRSKNLSFKNKSLVILKPYFYINSKFDIQTFNFKVIENINLKKIFEEKKLLKKLNTKNEIIFSSKKFNNKFIDDLNLKEDLAYGRMNYFKKLLISDNYFECQGNINFLDDYPLLFFNCSVDSKDKEKLLRIFSIETDSIDKVLKLSFSGNLNIFNKKINFKKIEIDDNYNASKEDLKYFKKTFEDILFDENFIKIFNLKKIKRFILEVS